MALSWFGKARFGKDPLRAVADALYCDLVAQARRTDFYGPGRVADTVEGRFDLLAFHLAILLRRLGPGDADRERLARRLVETFFRNLDDALRALGVGDLSMAKRMRRLAEAFYGRAEAYGAALDAGETGPDGDPLALAVARNVLGRAPDGAAAAIAAYGRAAAARLAALPDADLMAGRIEWPAPALTEATA